jgi:hypothetical protein
MDQLLSSIISLGPDPSELSLDPTEVEKIHERKLPAILLRICANKSLIFSWGVFAGE